jgi:hypothetical protein
LRRTAPGGQRFDLLGVVDPRVDDPARAREVLQLLREMNHFSVIQGLWPVLQAEVRGEGRWCMLPCCGALA